jgi:MFS family permease
MVLFYWIGCLVGQLTISWVADRYGRRRQIMLATIAQIPLIFGVSIMNNLYLAFPMYFLLGICYVGRYLGGYCAIIEYSEPKYKTLLGTFLLVMDGFIYILVIFFFKYIRDTQILEFIGIGINIFGVLAIYWLPETPEFLYNTYNFKQARLVLKRIAKTNGLIYYDDSNMLFDTEVDLMRCELSKITPSDDMLH